VEQIGGLRMVPNLAVVRPADGPETAMAWTLALERRGGPTALILTRQPVPPLQRPAGFDPRLMFRGGYVVSEPPAPAGGAPVVLIGSGSEVAPCVEAAAVLSSKGVPARVVSMPAPDIFLEQPDAYRRAVLPEGARPVVVEAARLHGWARVVGRDALFLGVDRFGASAPYKVLAEKFGFTGSQVAGRVLGWLGRS
jgi:transketolase